MKKIISIITVVVIVIIVTFITKDTSTKQTNTEVATSTMQSSGTIKEFVMESYVNMVNGKPAPRFSLDTITVKKGDTVRIKITTTSGHHNFKLDEFNVYKDTPTGQETIIEFVADKAGEFIYYCAQPGHRANGHWGTLTVLN